MNFNFVRDFLTLALYGNLHKPILLYYFIIYNMPYNPHSFYIHDVFDRSSKLLTEYEKNEILNIYSTVYKTDIPIISIDDMISIYLGAKENDIICIKNSSNNDVYRLVVKRETFT